MDTRRGMDGRRLPPRNARGEFTRRGRGRRMDRGMYDMGYPEMRGDMNYGDMARGGRGRGRNDYGDYGEYDMRGRGMDGHYPQGQGSTYYPIQAMGTFEGYYGMPEQDFARGGRGGDMGYRNYDMRGRDYGYPMHGEHYPPYDYGYPYDDYGDYGETLSDKELEEWNKKLLGQLDEREKQMFSKDAIMQKAKQMNKPMEGFGEKELYTATLAMYTDHKQSIGQNPDLSVKLGYDFLADKDVAVKGAQKLAVYYDCIVEGEE